MELLPGTFEGEKCVILCVSLCVCLCVCPAQSAPPRIHLLRLTLLLVKGHLSDRGPEAQSSQSVSCVSQLACSRQKLRNMWPSASSPARQVKNSQAGLASHRRRHISALGICRREAEKGALRIKHYYFSVIWMKVQRTTYTGMVPSLGVCVCRYQTSMLSVLNSLFSVLGKLLRNPMSHVLM